MTTSELRDKIQRLAKEVILDRKQATIAAMEYDELTKFPELKEVIVDLLGPQFDIFLSSIDWVAPKPTTFRINLKNNQSFYLIYTNRSWIAKVEGKKYYLLNLPEEERAIESIARILSYGSSSNGEETETTTDITTSTPSGETNVDIETDTETEEQPTGGN